MEIGKKKTEQRHGSSTRRVDKIQTGLFPLQKKRNRKIVQVINMILSS